jgi:TRAP-type C4-dicarboxylate transport system permease small subunit
VVIGWRYFNACPINQLIPYYLIVAGMVGLVIVILISITQSLTRIFARKRFDDTIDTTNPTQTTMVVGCGVCSIMCINLFLVIFLIVWSVVGWIWIIEVWHRVQYYRVEKDDYCHAIVYQFTFSLLLLTTTFKLMFFCFVCRKTCVRVTSNQRRDTIISDEY